MTDRIEVPTPHTGSSLSTSTRSSLTALEESTQKINGKDEIEKKLEGDEKSIGNAGDVIWVDWEENE